jgi:F-type H+-transporting ATPase subunit delta
LQTALSRQASRSVFVQVIVDEQVLGGGRVELGDEVIEGTVAARLENARRLFS